MITDFLIQNWKDVLLVVFILNALVAATPCKWDDLIWTGIKKGISKALGKKIN
jgi:hypothetical protein